MRIGDKLIEFELEIDGEIPAKLIGDELRIKQVLNNLLSNAFKYTEQGKVTLSVSGTRLSETEAELVFCVRDTGCGMSEEQLAKLFDEYSRFCQESGRAIEGTGLGMAITQRLIRLMDSKIEVESAPGKGSVFTVRVPQKTVNGEVLSAETMESLRRFRFNQMLQKRKSSFAREPMPYGSVLVVDDVETNLYVAMGLMKLYRLKIDTARSGLEAIGKIKGGTKYDIVFMDHMMPGMDGMETTKRLRDMGYTEPIAALTANVVAGQAEVFLQNGFDDFIGKPIDIRQLDTILNKYIRDKQPPEVLAAARSQKNAAGAGGSPPQKEMLLDFFIEDARNTIAELDELKNCYDGEENLQRFFITVHGIKSSLQYIGKTELSDSANELECAAREQNIALIKESAPGFTDKLRGLLESIERERVSDEDGTDVDIGGLRGKLQDLAEMCGNYDRKGALDCIVGIAGCSPETRGILERIRGHIMHSEFEDAQSAAADYAGKLYALPYEIAGLDADKGLERCGGDIKLYRRILRSYASTVREMLGAIDCLDEDNLGDYILAAHSIKGASFDVFAEQVGETAKLLEAAGKERNLNCLRENSAAFVEAAGTLIDGIEKALSVIEAENPKPSKDKPDGKILAKLLYACRKYSMDDVDGAMEEIERYTYTNDDGLADWLKDNADRMNLTQIAERLSTL
jgi:CheY-like chemotaxis protein